MERDHMPVRTRVINALDSVRQHIRRVDSLNMLQYSKCLFIVSVLAEYAANHKQQSESMELVKKIWIL